MFIKYLFIGVIVSFLIDLLLGMDKIKENPKVAEVIEKGEWGWGPRILNIFMWPVSVLIFVISFLNQFLKK